MNHIDIKTLKEESSHIAKALERTESRIENLQQGNLYIYRNKNGDVYYRRGYFDNDGIRRVEYLPKSNMTAVREQAERMYLIKLAFVLRKELKALCHFIDHYHPEEKAFVLDQMDPEVAKLVEPEFISDDEADRIWRSEEYDKSSDHPEALRYKTLKGDMVRSKTEALLADLFYYHSLAYRYEAALLLPSGYTCHPDFTIRRKSDGKIFYWEHLGRIDSPTYLENAVYKLNQYAKAGITLGDNLLITWETANQPFDRTAAEKYIELLK